MVARHFALGPCGQASGFAVTLTEGNAPILSGDIACGKTLFWTFVPQGADSSSAAFAEQISVRWVTPVKLHIAYANWMIPTVKEVRHGTVEVEYEITSTPLPKYPSPESALASDRHTTISQTALEPDASNAGEGGSTASEEQSAAATKA
jgi:hypothetical protein